MRALRLDRVGMNVRDLDSAIAFYTTALGFSMVGVDAGDAAMLGARSVRRAVLRRGGQHIELTACDPAGAAYPLERASNDLCFQHIALAVDDIDAAYARLCLANFKPISLDGPQILPGGIVAFKFRDQDGHPLELIQFPDGDARTAGGIDHSAISVSDAAASVAFYGSTLGLDVSAQQVNSGPAQEALDGLRGAIVDVVALAPADAAPHLELLGYRAPRGRAANPGGLSDIAVSRLVFAVADLPATRILRDPDGHVCVLEPATPV